MIPIASDACVFPFSTCSNVIHQPCRLEVSEWPQREVSKMSIPIGKEGLQCSEGPAVLGGSSHAVTSAMVDVITG